MIWIPGYITTDGANVANVSKLVSVVVGLEGIQHGFLQLILTKTWVKCTSLDSSRCVVNSGIRFKAIQAASN